MASRLSRAGTWQSSSPQTPSTGCFTLSHTPAVSRLGSSAWNQKPITWGMAGISPASTRSRLLTSIRQAFSEVSMVREPRPRYRSWLPSSQRVPGQILEGRPGVAACGLADPALVVGERGHAAAREVARDEGVAVTGRGLGPVDQHDPGMRPFALREGDGARQLHSGVLEGDVLFEVEGIVRGEPRFLAVPHQRDPGHLSRVIAPDGEHLVRVVPRLEEVLVDGAEHDALARPLVGGHADGAIQGQVRAVVEAVGATNIRGQRVLVHHRRTVRLLC